MTHALSLSFEPGAVLATLPLAPGHTLGISLSAAGGVGLATPGARLAAGRVYAVHQVHSKRIVVVQGREPQSLSAQDADGMVTDLPDAVLTVTVADCLPIFLVDQATGAFGLVHSGWKGTGIVVEAIRTMAKAFGTRAANLAAAIGPGIGACCYTVPRDRHEAFRAEFGEQAAPRGANGDFRLDLRAANVRLLEAVGVQRIVVTTDCTCCSTVLGSFRRDGPGFHRMLAFIGRAGVPGLAGARSGWQRQSQG